MKCAEYLLTEYENSIRAEERWKFVEWLTKSKYSIIEPFGFKKFLFDTTIFSIDFVIAEYEKQMKEGERE